MDVAKLPPAGIPVTRAPTISPGEPGSPSTGNIATIADRADIRPLDVPAALQILLAEVRAAFESQALLMDGEVGSESLDSPMQAARVLVDMAVQSLPEVASVPVWTQALMGMEIALQAGLERAIDAVSAWRDVSGPVVDAAKETRVLVFAVLGDDAQNPIWLRPEWAGLAPRFERFWRRRRIARRRLTDPDYSSGGSDDNNEPET